MKTRDNAAVTGVEDDVKRIVAVVTPLAGLVASILGGLAGFTGGFSRTVRNEPHLVWFGAAALLIGFFYTAWAFFRYPGTEPASQANRTRSLSIALFAFGLAFIFGVLATVRTIHDPQAPGVALAWNADTGSADATVTARNLRTETRVIVAVYGAAENTTASTALWRSSGMSDADGSVSIPVSVAVDRARFDSVVVKAWTGAEEPDCAIGESAPEGPNLRLRAPWDPSEPLSTCATMAIPPVGGHAIDVKVDMVADEARVVGSVGGGIRRGESLLVSVLSIDDGIELYASEIPWMEGGGPIPISVELGAARSVCVTALRIEHGQDTRIPAEATSSCPPEGLDRALVAWVMLRASTEPAAVPNTASPSPSP